MYVLARSEGRVDKERAMRRRRLKKLIARLRELQKQKLTHDELLMKLGAARTQAGRAYALLEIDILKREAREKTRALRQSFRFTLNRKKLREVRQREGHYLLRTNLSEQDPARLWEFYIQLTEVEQAFKELKSDLSVRPIYHQKDKRIEAHIFVAFLAYCLQVTLKAKLKPLASGLTARSVLEKFAAVQMLDVHLPTTDDRELVLTRYTEPEKDLQLLLMQMKLTLPSQPPPKLRVAHTENSATAMQL
jgi:transposase